MTERTFVGIVAAGMCALAFISSLSDTANTVSTAIALALITLGACAAIRVLWGQNKRERIRWHSIQRGKTGDWHEEHH